MNNNPMLGPRVELEVNSKEAHSLPVQVRIGHSRYSLVSSGIGFPSRVWSSRSPSGSGKSTGTR